MYVHVCKIRLILFNTHNYQKLVETKTVYLHFTLVISFVLKSLFTYIISLFKLTLTLTNEAMENHYIGKAIQNCHCSKIKIFFLKRMQTSLSIV